MKQVIIKYIFFKYQTSYYIRELYKQWISIKCLLYKVGAEPKSWHDTTTCFKNWVNCVSSFPAFDEHELITLFFGMTVKKFTSLGIICDTPTSIPHYHYKQRV
jgi:hypothetical protein